MEGDAVHDILTGVRGLACGETTTAAPIPVNGLVLMTHESPCVLQMWSKQWPARFYRFDDHEADMVNAYHLRDRLIEKSNDTQYVQPVCKEQWGTFFLAG